jgi:hypothetical protein
VEAAAQELRVVGEGASGLGSGAWHQRSAAARHVRERRRRGALVWRPEAGPAAWGLLRRESVWAIGNEAVVPGCGR